MELSVSLHPNEKSRIIDGLDHQSKECLKSKLPRKGMQCVQIKGRCKQLCSGMSKVHGELLRGWGDECQMVSKYVNCHFPVMHFRPLILKNDGSEDYNRKR